MTSNLQVIIFCASLLSPRRTSVQINDTENSTGLFRYHDRMSAFCKNTKVQGPQPRLQMSKANIHRRNRWQGARSFVHICHYRYLVTVCEFTGAWARAMHIKISRTLREISIQLLTPSKLTSPDKKMSDKKYQMSAADAARIQATQSQNDSSKGSFPARAQRAAASNANAAPKDNNAANKK